MKQRRLISVIIPSYNSARTIQRTLAGIKSQISFDKILEIIIVDSSDDNLTPEILNKEKCKIVKVVNSGVKVIPAKQRNIGASLAKGQLLVFIDSDAIPLPDWLCQIVIAYLKGYKVGGGSYLMDSVQAISNKMAVAEYYFELGEFLPSGNIREKKMVPTCNLFCEREIFIETGGFPNIRAAEDSLFGLNVNKKRPVYFIPKATVIHVFRNDKKGALNNLKLLGVYAIVHRKISCPEKYDQKALLILLYPVLLVWKFLRVYLRTLFIGINHFISLNRSLYHFIQCFLWWSSGVWQGIFCKPFVSAEKLATPDLSIFSKSRMWITRQYFFKTINR